MFCIVSQPDKQTKPTLPVSKACIVNLLLQLLFVCFACYSLKPIAGWHSVFTITNRVSNASLRWVKYSTVWLLGRNTLFALLIGGHDIEHCWYVCGCCAEKSSYFSAGFLAMAIEKIQTSLTRLLLSGQLQLLAFATISPLKNMFV